MHPIVRIARVSGRNLRTPNTFVSCPYGTRDTVGDLPPHPSAVTHSSPLGHGAYQLVRGKWFFIMESEQILSHLSASIN